MAHHRGGGRARGDTSRGRGPGQDTRGGHFNFTLLTAAAEAAKARAEPAESEW